MHIRGNANNNPNDMVADIFQRLNEKTKFDFRDGFQVLVTLVFFFRHVLKIF